MFFFFSDFFTADQIRGPSEPPKGPFYKFLHETSGHAVLKSCLEGNIMFSRIPELNDFSETFAVADRNDIEKSLPEIQKNGLGKDEQGCFCNHVELMKKIFPDLKDLFDALKSLGLSNQLDSLLQPDSISRLASQFGVPLKDPLAEFKDVLPEMLQLTNENIQERIGIFCVAEIFESFSLWAHYADNAKGFVIEYKNLGELFKGDGKTDVLDKLTKVEYYDGERRAVQFHPSKLNEMFFSKHNSWKYEGEYRVIKPLSECKKIIVGNGCEKHFYKIDPKEYINRIIVGWKGDFEDIRDYVKNMCEIPVVQAVVEEGNIVISKENEA